MARKGEIADIVSKAQFDYFAKQAQSAFGKTKPLDARGQSRNAERDEDGNIVRPGGGKADAPPSAKQAIQALTNFHSKGGKREDLPQTSSSKDAYRKDAEHAKMRRDKVIRLPVRPRGSSNYERRGLQAQGYVPRKGKYAVNRFGGWEYVTPTQRTLAASKYYVSKSINEEFLSKLDEVLGL